MTKRRNGGKTASNKVTRARARDETGHLILLPGQPCIGSKLCDELEERILGFIASGMSQTDACGLVDISRETLYRWKEKGAAEPESRYGQFLEACERAELECKK